MIVDILKYLFVASSFLSPPEGGLDLVTNR